MILIKPEWGAEKAEDIWALYYYLLYTVLPFPPCAYLPKDETGYYYYENGDRSTPRIYVETVRSNCKQKESLYTTINDISKELCDFLYIDPNTVNRDHLRQLLTTPTDQKTLEDNHLKFPLNRTQLDRGGRIEAWKPLLRIFNYDKFSSRPLFSKLVQLLEVNVCPYCNRSFATTTRTRRGAYQRHNQVDHYCAKALYPWFAISLLNFIPSCANCNHKKSDDDNFVLYPYFEEFGMSYRFRTVPISGLGYLQGELNSEKSFRVEIEPVPGAVLEADYRQRVEHAVEKFGLDVLYRESHNAYIRRIFEQRFFISDAYIDSLCDSFPHHFKSRQDVCRMLYLKSLDEAELHQEPLAKLTHDIDWEINELT